MSVGVGMWSGGDVCECGVVAEGGEGASESVSESVSASECGSGNVESGERGGGGGVRRVEWNIVWNGKERVD